MSFIQNPLWRTKDLSRRSLIPRVSRDIQFVCPLWFINPSMGSLSFPFAPSGSCLPSQTHCAMPLLCRGKIPFFVSMVICNIPLIFLPPQQAFQNSRPPLLCILFLFSPSSVLCKTHKRWWKDSHWFKWLVCHMHLHVCPKILRAVCLSLPSTHWTTELVSQGRKYDPWRAYLYN